MCGRYILIPNKGWVLSPQIEAKDRELKLNPNYNVAPNQTMPIITSEGIKMMRWGLVPSWSKEFKPSFTTINARSETAAEKPTFRAPSNKQRCLVPASGFYEWDKVSGSRKPYLFKLSDRPVFSFAGLFDVWFDPEGNKNYSYTILTTNANSLVGKVHNRMPVILDDDEEAYWLSSDSKVEDLKLLLNPLQSNKMGTHEVGRDVGNVKNNHAELVLPINSANSA